MASYPGTYRVSLDHVDRIMLDQSRLSHATKNLMEGCRVSEAEGEEQDDSRYRMAETAEGTPAGGRFVRLLSSRSRASSAGADIWSGAETTKKATNVLDFAKTAPSKPSIDPTLSLLPKLTIAILVVGTRGDVQPFCAVAMRLRDKYGHRVRLATHAIYRDFVESLGIEFFPLAGDPKSLSAFMVKTKGNLFPTSREHFQLMADQPFHLMEIARSTWPAVSEPDPENPDRSFACDAIIANPVCWGHYHVAEALGVPLHIMFPQPWSPTREFPHPMSRLAYSEGPSLQNKLSYTAMDILMWAPLSESMNRFRRDHLNIPPIRIGEAGATIISDMNVPMSFMWSPSLCPKASDWGEHISVIGNIFLDNKSTGGSSYVPSPELADFLFGHRVVDGVLRPHPAPVFIGFGSMMIREPLRLTRMIVAAAIRSNTRVLIQSSWSSMSDGSPVPENVFFLGPAPHDWLLPKMAAVVHHGGAGTTAAGIRCGKPTFICPFFGDQHFWGWKIYESGVGLKPCPIENLTEEILADAFLKLSEPRSELRQKAKAMAKCWREGEGSQSTKRSSLTEKEFAGQDVIAGHPEDGITNGCSAFHKNLPLASMCCDITSAMGNTQRPRVARWVHKHGLMKICDEVLDTLLVPMSDSDRSVTKLSDWRRWTPVQWGSHSVGGAGKVSAVMDGYKRGVGALLHETVQGVADLVRQPYLGVQRAKKNEKLKGFAKGTAKGVFNVVARPVHGALEFVDSVTTGHIAAASGKAQQGYYKHKIRPAMRRKWNNMVEDFTLEPRQRRVESTAPTESFIFNNNDAGSTAMKGSERRKIVSTFDTLLQSARVKGFKSPCVPILIGRTGSVKTGKR